MSKSDSVSKIKLSSFNDLFGINDAMRDVGGVREIMVNELHEFKDHPFKPVNKEKLDELVQSIKENGVLVPGIARIRSEGGYEIIAGHNRVQACKIAGISTIPMFVRNISDDEAVIAMIDSNIQREDILPSEKAKAYRMKYDAIKHQGKKGNSLNEIGEVSGESVKNIQRYLWISRLSDELLELMDQKKIGFVQGTDISFLSEKEQKWVLAAIEESRVKINTKQSADLKKMSKERELSEDKVREILVKENPIKKERRIILGTENLNEYFPDNYSEEEIKSVIISLLNKWKAEGNDNAG